MRSARAALAAVLVTLAACAAVFASLSSAAGPPPAAGATRVVLSTVPADVPTAMLGGKVDATVTVRALVAPSGLVDSARAVAGDPRLRASAEAAVRWWVFGPAPARAWTTVRVPFTADADAEPLRPDVLAIAKSAEAGGNFREAFDAWVGALNRLGQNPSVNNEWAMRERAIALAHRLSPRPDAGNVLRAEGLRVRAAQLRSVAREDHAELVPRFDVVLAGSPWWADAYLWRAGSLAGCGRVTDALRSLRAYEIASEDSAGLVFASRMIDGLAQSDTVGVCAAIKTWELPPDPPAAH